MVFKKKKKKDEEVERIEFPEAEEDEEDEEDQREVEDFEEIRKKAMAYDRMRESSIEKMQESPKPKIPAIPERYIVEDVPIQIERGIRDQKTNKRIDINTAIVRVLNLMEGS